MSRQDDGAVAPEDADTRAIRARHQRLIAVALAGGVAASVASASACLRLASPEDAGEDAGD